MAEKIFYSMGEVAEMFDVKTSLIRHWETQFSVLKPKRNKKGNRLFSPEDVENLKVIYHLVKERGMTLEGAKRAMKRRAANGDEIRREAELMTRLKHIRTLLLEVREDLKTGGEGIVDEDKEPTETDAPQAEEERIAKPEPEEPKEPAEEDRPAEPEEDMQF
ncbi:MAG: MerR family transcriptional regulator, partial [Alistipes sp.]|nr:MerR family transcriptional regulator [Alistipes sp.]